MAWRQGRPCLLYGPALQGCQQVVDQQPSEHECSNYVGSKAELGGGKDPSVEQEDGDLDQGDCDSIRLIASIGGLRLSVSGKVKVP